MDTFKKLTPSEVLLLIEPSTKSNDLLRPAFMNLVFHQVLELNEVINKEERRDKYGKLELKEIKTEYVVKGKNFETYKAKEHEQLFIDIFLKSNKQRISIKNYLKAVAENSGSSYSYISLVVSSLKKQNLLKQNSLQWFLRRYSYTELGDSEKEYLSNYLEEIDHSIESDLKDNPEESLQKLDSLQGSVFLLKNIDFNELKSASKEFNNTDIKNSIFQSEHLQNAQQLENWSNLIIGATFMDFLFDAIDDHWDSTFSSCNGSSCNSCSSCGSSCGSCGGD